MLIDVTCEAGGWLWQWQAITIFNADLGTRNRFCKIFGILKNRHVWELIHNICPIKYGVSNHLPISVNRLDLPMSVKEWPISVNQTIDISYTVWNTFAYRFTDIGEWFTDIGKLHDLPISVKDWPISVIHLPTSVIHFPISVNNFRYRYLKYGMKVLLIPHIRVIID